MPLTQNNSIRHILYEQKGGYLLVPTFILLALSITAIALPVIEQSLPGFSHSIRDVVWLTPKDPGMAQLMLGAIAGSCITIVSVVYSLLLIALTFASMQFSPRILTNFVKDRVTQVTLGLFVGTFAYCLLLIPSVRSGAHAWMPQMSLTLAMALAASCFLVLTYFINHIAFAIQVNYIVDRIASEIERVLKFVFGPPHKGHPKEQEAFVEPSSGTQVLCRKSGYIQYVDIMRLFKLAVRTNSTICIHRNVGQYIPAGVPCITITPIESCETAQFGAQIQNEALSCFEMGPLRSMEEDVEFGVLQLVDIALKAISPAVNDPSTAINCIDRLSQILSLAAKLDPPETRLSDDKGVVRIIRRQSSFPRLLGVAYDQIIRYGKGDMAVSLRLMRALQDVSTVTTYLPYLSAILGKAQQVVKGCEGHFQGEELEELLQRRLMIEKAKAAASQEMEEQLTEGTMGGATEVFG